MRNVDHVNFKWGVTRRRIRSHKVLLLSVAAIRPVLDSSVMERIAYGVLGGKIARIKDSSVAPAWLASQLLAADIIGEEEEIAARNTEIPKAQRREELVELVMAMEKRAYSKGL